MRTANAERSEQNAEPHVRVAGRLIVQRLLASSAFASSRRVGVYVSCERLHEVDTRELLRVLLQPGRRRTRRRCIVRRLTRVALSPGAPQCCLAPLVGVGPAEMEFYRIGAQFCIVWAAQLPAVRCADCVLG